MFRLTKRADYALSFLSYLALRKGRGLVTLAELAGLGYPRAFVAQIAKDLVKAGVLRSVEGRSGGYELAKVPGSLQIKDVLEVVEGKISVVDCLAGKNCKIKDNCCQRGFMGRFSNRMEKILSDYTVADLIS
jgi:Rrf2 family protein